MFDLGGLLGIVLFGLWLYCLIDVVISDRDQVRWLPKWAWFALVFLLSFVGAILWLLAGRPSRPFTGGYEGDTPPTAAARTLPIRRVRPTRTERVEDEAAVQARIAERDRLLAKWAEEDRRKAGEDLPPGNPPTP